MLKEARTYLGLNPLEIIWCIEGPFFLPLNLPSRTVRNEGWGGGEQGTEAIFSKKSSVCIQLCPKSLPFPHGIIDNVSCSLQRPPQKLPNFNLSSLRFWFQSSLPLSFHPNNFFFSITFFINTEHESLSFIFTKLRELLTTLYLISLLLISWLLFTGPPDQLNCLILHLIFPPQPLPI